MPESSASAASGVVLQIGRVIISRASGHRVRMAQIEYSQLDSHSEGFQQGAVFWKKTPSRRG